MCWTDWLSHLPDDVDSSVGGAQGKDGPVGSPMFLEEQDDWARALSGDYEEDPAIGELAEFLTWSQTEELAESPDAWGRAGPDVGYADYEPKCYPPRHAWMGPAYASVGADLETANSNQAWTTSSGAARGACLAAGLYWDAKAGKCVDKAPGGAPPPAPSRPPAGPPQAPPAAHPTAPSAETPSGTIGGVDKRTAGLAAAGLVAAILVAKVVGL